MSPRKSGPVLLELLKDNPRPTVPGAGVPAAEPVSGAGMWNWAGRTIRVPAGYIFAAVAVFVAFGLLGYVIGYGRAERVAEADAVRRAQQAVPAHDPLDDAPLNLNLTSPRPEDPAVEPGLSPVVPETGRADAASEAEEAAEPGGDRAPLRQAGLNYYVIVRDLPAEGDRLVAWLDGRGIPAMTEPVGGGLVKVIVLEGFARGQASSAQALSYKEHLRELGRRWKREHRGSSDFSDLYLEKYSG